MSQLGLYLQLSKIDPVQRLVYGVATAESPDRSGEICDYASSKPYFERWSSDIAKSTGGKSLGNVRSMHSKIAAGKLTAINFNDSEKSIEVCAKIVDDAEWEKVTEGVYTGFSQGGRYVRRWPDENTDLTRYTAEPSEISLVDLPCLPEATFSVIKADGAIEKRHFKVAEPATKDMEEAAGKPDDEDETKEDGDAEMAAKDDDAEMAAKDGDGMEECVTEAVKAEESAGADAANIKVADADPDEPVQTWKCHCPEHQHPTKREAKACKKRYRIAAAAKAITDPVDDRLAEISAALGIEKTAADPAVAGDQPAAVISSEPEADVEKREFSAAQREKDAQTGVAMEDGSYPIKTRADLKNAIQAFGRAKDKEKTKAHIIARAKALGATDELPEDWTAKVAEPDGVEKDAAAVTDKAAVHASMAHFHAQQASGPNGDLHKAAAGAHAEAFLAHAIGADDKEEKSAFAFEATNKCYGMAQAAGLPAMLADPAALGKALASRVFDKLGKGLATCARLGCLIEDLNSILSCVRTEAAMESDDSPLPKMLAQNLSGLCAALVAMVSEETGELVAGTEADGDDSPNIYSMAADIPRIHRDALVKLMLATPGLEKAGAALEGAGKGELFTSLVAFERAVEERRVEKIGARNSRSDQERVQKVHDLAKELGAGCASESSGDKSAGTIDLLKTQVIDLTEENAAFKDKLAGYAPKLEEISRRLKAMEAQPVPAKAAIRAVGKGEDVVDGGGPKTLSKEDAFALFAKMAPDERALFLTKLSLANPKRL